MTLAVLPVRAQGRALGECLAGGLADHHGGAELLRPWEEVSSPRELLAARFSDFSGWVLIMASGIATRFLSGLPVSKLSDPAVVVIDEGARFAVSLLSGHEGQANALAYQVANLTGAVPVVTTATEALKPLTLGIGCRRGVSAAQIEQAVLRVIPERLSEVREVATIDLKADEPGLLDFCLTHGLPLRIFKAADLQARPFVTQPSAWVTQVTGAAGVCEPCALLASPRGQLIVPKAAYQGVTVAAVEDVWTELGRVDAAGGQP
ncbi:cobalamin biosynthesis protein [Deinococcus arenicola]|uniref:Cobalamin biosynthesis protein n=1 Tax=Deinococcus arenicola TaxID=2994950 RepID=A0ABU4DTH8_9DEIO|nr:cobalamin biosynthesis protein [Deinococcus sp. ZS9-10]MDV6375737.1 cobalamin biosynthesis protein [Deinococcus sp. ZS9-10]